MYVCVYACAKGECGEGMLICTTAQNRTEDNTTTVKRRATGERNQEEINISLD